MVAPAKKKFRFRNKLFSLDATLIELCVSLFDWATYRQTKGAVKLHLLLDHDGYFPVFAHITDGRTHEVKIAQNLSLPKGSIVVMDRGYVDYALFARWKKEGVWFVSRQKGNANYTVIEDRPVPVNRSIVADQLIILNVYYSQKHYPYPLRRIEVWDEIKRESVVFITNHMTFGATTIASIYKDRWQIEVFFKTIKQNLKIKTFVGTSANALMIQIWTALIALLILKYMTFRSQYGWSLSNLIAMLRYNLFTYRELWAWLDSPYEVPPLLPTGEQLVLEL
jgi:IS4 transposase